MRFDKTCSIAEIMEDSNISKYIKGLYPTVLLQFVPENMFSKSLEEVEREVRMPWGLPFGSDDFVQAANTAAEIAEEDSYAFIPLWSDGVPEFMPEFKNDQASVCMLTTKSVNDRIRPAVIVCPGGGYEMLSSQSEGIAVAQRLEQEGYHAFVLYYRVKPNYYPTPQKDLALAMKYLRANYKEYRIEPDNIMIMGFSAGGHLCASFAAEYEEYGKALIEDLEKEIPALAEKYRQLSVRPDRVCLGYPVISFMEEAHEPSFLALTDGKEEVREKLSIELQVDNSYPKTFVWACKDDDLVPVSNAIRMGEALQKAGVLAKLEIFPTGGHGCGLAAGTSAESWMEDMLRFMEKAD